jgi:hypothetical protein
MEVPMLNGLGSSLTAMRAFSVVSMLLATVDPTGLTHAVAYADSDVEATEQSHERAKVVCVLAETVRRHVVTVVPSCTMH